MIINYSKFNNLCQMHNKLDLRKKKNNYSKSLSFIDSFRGSITTKLFKKKKKKIEFLMQYCSHHSNCKRRHIVVPN